MHDEACRRRLAATGFPDNSERLAWHHLEDDTIDGAHDGAGTEQGSSDRVLVMYLGRVAEIGPSRTVLGKPTHPYTQALVASVPSMDPTHRTQVAPLSGDPPNPINPPPGCRFHPRCRIAEPLCSQSEPRLDNIGAQHRVACHAAKPGSGHTGALATMANA